MARCGTNTHPRCKRHGRVSLIWRCAVHITVLELLPVTAVACCFTPLAVPPVRRRRASTAAIVCPTGMVWSVTRVRGRVACA